MPAPNNIFNNSRSSRGNHQSDGNHRNQSFGNVGNRGNNGNSGNRGNQHNSGNGANRGNRQNYVNGGNRGNRQNFGNGGNRRNQNQNFGNRGTHQNGANVGHQENNDFGLNFENRASLKRKSLPSSSNETPKKSKFSESVTPVSNNEVVQQLVYLTDEVKFLRSNFNRLDRDVSSNYLLIFNGKLPIVEDVKENYSKMLEFVKEVLLFILGEEFNEIQLLQMPEMSQKKDYIRISLGSLLISKVMKNLPKMKEFQSKIVTLKENFKQFRLQKQLPSNKIDRQSHISNLKKELIELFRDHKKNNFIQEVPLVKVVQNQYFKIKDDDLVELENGYEHYSNLDNLHF